MFGGQFREFVLAAFARVDIETDGVRAGGNADVCFRRERPEMVDGRLMRGRL
jgi:hypothetical protein